VAIEIVIARVMSTRVRDESNPEPRQRLVVQARGVDLGEGADLFGDDPLRGFGPMLA
jgi:hypothetical protein